MNVYVQKAILKKNWMLGLGRYTKKQEMPLFQQNYFQTRLKLHGLIAMSKNITFKGNKQAKHCKNKITPECKKILTALKYRMKYNIDHVIHTISSQVMLKTCKQSSSRLLQIKTSLLNADEKVLHWSQVCRKWTTSIW